MTEAAEPDFAAHVERIRDRLGREGFMSLVGVELAAISPGTCTLEVARRPELLQQHDMFHGGVTACLVDHAITVAAWTLIRPGQATLTAEYKLNMISPAVASRLVCRARVVKPGRRLSVVSAEVFGLDEGREKQTAVALGTIAIVALDAIARPADG